MNLFNHDIRQLFFNKMFHIYKTNNLLDNENKNKIF